MVRDFSVKKQKKFQLKQEQNEAKQAKNVTNN